MEEFPIVQRRLLFIQRNSENNANDAEVKHFVLNNIPIHILMELLAERTQSTEGFNREVFENP